MRKEIVLALAVLLLLPFSAEAEFTLGQYRQIVQDPALKERLDSYLTGVGRGVFWANVMLRAQKKRQLFCMPAELSLDEGIIESLFDQEIRRPTKSAHYGEDTPIELILISAFIQRFPCEE